MSDLMIIDCPKCDEWVEWNNNDPRRKAIGYGFEFHAEDDTFTCVDCKVQAVIEMIEDEEEL